MLTFRKASTPQDFEVGKTLFIAYAEELGVDLTFQNFDDELKSIAQQYGDPTGHLLIGYSGDHQAIGCVGIRRLDPNTCELKRMYVVNSFRNKGIGQQMVEMILESAIQLGYKKIRLDTLSTMKSAINLYTKYGFYEVEPYRYNPIEGAIYFEKKLVQG